MLKRFWREGFVLLVSAVALTGCSTQSQARWEEKTLKDVDKSKVSFVKDANYKMVDGRLKMPFLSFISAYSPSEGKKILFADQSNGQPRNFVVLPPGQFVLSAHCTFEKAYSDLSIPITAVAGKTILIECSPVPENDFKSYLKFDGIKDTE